MEEMQHSEQMEQQKAVADGPERLELKPERVQQLLLKLPGWRLGREGRAIERRRQFTSLAEAQAFVARVGKLATRHRQPVTIGLSGKRVNVSLAGHPVKRRAGGLTNEVFNLAGLLG